MTLEDAKAIQIECDKAGGMFKVDPSTWPQIKEARDVLYKQYGDDYRRKIWSTEH